MADVCEINWTDGTWRDINAAGLTEAGKLRVGQVEEMAPHDYIVARAYAIHESDRAGSAKQRGCAQNAIS